MRVEAAAGRGALTSREHARKKKSGADANLIHQVCARAAGGCGFNLFVRVD
jgi:hypothetical protein